MYDSELGFRHGPKSIIDDNTPTVAYLSDDEYRRRYELDLVREMAHQRKGNKLLLFTTVISANYELADYAVQIRLVSQLPMCCWGLDFVLLRRPLPPQIAVFGYHPDNPARPAGESCSQGCDPVPYT